MGGGGGKIGTPDQDMGSCYIQQNIDILHYTVSDKNLSDITETFIIQTVCFALEGYVKHKQLW